MASPLFLKKDPLDFFDLKIAFDDSGFIGLKASKHGGVSFIWPLFHGLEMYTICENFSIIHHVPI